MNDKLSQAYLSIKESEDKLKKHQIHLEDMVEQRNKELLRQQVFTDAVLDNINDGIVACDADGTLSLFNKAIAFDILYYLLAFLLNL